MSGLSSEENVYIVLATYNGERFLKKQIDSIRSQTFRDWHLLIGDDGSSDSTLEIALAAAREDSRIEVVPSRLAAPVGAVENFATLLDSAYKAGAHLCFVADQDDIWCDTKMAHQLRCFPQSGLENKALLVHSDLQLISDEGTTLFPSFFRHRGLTPVPCEPLNQLLSLNYVTGCSVCVNRSLLGLATPIPSGTIMHDWWLALGASACGEIKYVPDKLLAYRQHEHNVVGAAGEAAIIKRASRWRENWRRGNAEFQATFYQAEKLIARLQERHVLSSEAEETLGQYLGIMGQHRLGRILTAHRLGLRQGKMLLRLVFYWRLLCVNFRVSPP
jgi:hypothetical protein